MRADLAVGTTCRRGDALYAELSKWHIYAGLSSRTSAQASGTVARAFRVIPSHEATWPLSTRSHRSLHVDPGRVVMADGDTAEAELEEIRCGNRVFSGSSAPALHEHPINKDLIAHFKSKGDSVSWGIAESIERYEEDTKKKVLRGADIASLYDQETERELAREVENRIEEALLSARRPEGIATHFNEGDFEEATRELFRQFQRK